MPAKGVCFSSKNFSISARYFAIAVGLIALTVFFYGLPVLATEAQIKATQPQENLAQKLSIQDSHAPLVMSCQHPDQLGLFEQCLEVKVLEKVGERFRVYAKPSQKVLSVKAENLFFATAVQKFAKFEPGSVISIPANFLWNSSTEGYQSLCRFDKQQNLELAVVSCGHYQGAKIQKQFILKIEPYIHDPSVRPQRQVSAVSHNF